MIDAISVGAGSSPEHRPELTGYVAQVGERLEEVRHRIARVGDPSAVRIVAVTKTFGVDACAAALSLGIGDLGENYADELVKKAHELSLIDPRASARWHYLGSIQRNKVARLAPIVDTFDGVDRVEEGGAIARHCPGAAVLVEVAVTPSETKGGVEPALVSALVEQLVGLGLDVRGLMTIAPEGDIDAARSTFRAVRGLVDDLGLKEASMGMSDDLEVAVEEGATMVRIGRALFGPR